MRALALFLLTAGLIAGHTDDAAAQACEQRVAFALTEVTTAGCLTQVASAPDRWETSDAVVLNGLRLPVAPGTRLVLTGPGADAPGGRVAVRTEIAVAGLVVQRGVLEAELPAGGPGEERASGPSPCPPGRRCSASARAGTPSCGSGATGTGAATRCSPRRSRCPRCSRTGRGRERAA